MSGKPAARVTDPTACPLPGHGTNPIVSGSPNVNFDGLAAARMTDKSACGSPITGAVASTVFINGLNAEHWWSRQCRHRRFRHGHHR